MSPWSQIIKIHCISLLLLALSLKAGEIHNAVAVGDLDKVKTLLEADPELLESKGDRNFTPLMVACKNHRVEVADYLLDEGANVNAIGDGGMTPLFCFPYAQNPPFNLVKRLVNEGADVNAKLWLNRNWTVLVDFVRKPNVEIVKLLIDHGADPNIRDIEGTPLHMTMHHNRPFFGDLAMSHKLHEDIAICLVENGAELQEFSFGNTELHLAAMRGFANLIPVLLKHGAAIDAKNDLGRTPLFYATRHNHRHTAEALIAAGADTSAIPETNDNRAPELTASIKKEEALLWNLACVTSPHTAYAIKTKTHLLIFDAEWINMAPEAGLANGYLNPKELTGQNITVLTTLPRLDVTEVSRQLAGTEFVLCAKPKPDNKKDAGIPSYHLAKPDKDLSVNGINIHTISGASRLFGREGLGYLVEVDGVKIFHAGLHFSENNPSSVARFRKGIDALKSFGPIDFAILPITGRHINVAYEPYLYLIDQLLPKTIYLIGEELANEEHRKCLGVLAARDVPVFFPDGGIAIGQRFYYK